MPTLINQVEILDLMKWVGTFVLAVLLSLYISPKVQEAALRFGLVDKPDGRLKKQAVPVAYLGGVAVYLSFIIALSMVVEFKPVLVGILLGGTMMMTLGLFDDIRALTPSLKFLGQGIAVWISIKSGIVMEWEILPDALNYALTALWLIGITNAINLLDVSDGLASVTAAVASLFLAWWSLYLGNTALVGVSLALAGSALGFIRLNRPPATIYLGDAGSLFLGYMLAALTLLAPYSAQNRLGIFAPLFILALPIFETSLLVLARLLKRQSPFSGSPDHIAIRLKHRGLSSTHLMSFAVCVGFVFGMLAVTLSLGSERLGFWILASGLAFWILSLLATFRLLPPPPSVVDSRAAGIKNCQSAPEPSPPPPILERR